MNTIKNPIISGMAPDPSVIRVDDIYYLATSTFHWMPGIQIFQSNNLANWSLVDQVLSNEMLDLKGTNTPAGIWAPHLSYDEVNKRYWLTYSHMLNMNGREFNADTYIMTSDNIKGPWSSPQYVTSIGFDPSLFHDENGKHYISILEWESRTGYQAPGHIVIGEIDLKSGEMVSPWHRVTQGFTTRGAAEAPQIYKHNNYYYLMIAAGGTGYAHGIEIGRSRGVFGPYESHPSGEPIITSSPQHLFSLGDPDAGQFDMYNPDSPIQKSGHGSLVETNNGEWYITHLMSRPLPNTMLNPLGRETGLQKMKWDDQDWLEMEDGSNLAKVETPSMNNLNVEQSVQFEDISDDFLQSKYDNHFMTPYLGQNKEWVYVDERIHKLRIKGGNSLFSKMEPHIMATRATSFKYNVETMISFNADHYSEMAGVGLYYDSDNWIFLRLNYSEQCQSMVVDILQATLGERKEFINLKTLIESNNIKLRVQYENGKVSFLYKNEKDNDWKILIGNLDVSYLSDEGVNGAPGEIGGFTGLFNFIGVVDNHQHDSFADFDYYHVTNFE